MSSNIDTSALASFMREFESWLAQAALCPAEKVVAYAFRLVEVAPEPNGEYVIELIALRAFQPDNANWADSQVWEADPLGIRVPIEVSGQRWDQCLTAVCSLVHDYLKADHVNGRWLKAGRVVAVGFPLGDLVPVWRRQRSAPEASPR